MMSPSECCKLWLATHALRYLVIWYPLGRHLGMACWWWWRRRWWWYAVIPSWGLVIIIIVMNVWCRRCIVTETNTSHVYAIAVATLAASVDIIVVACFNDSVLQLLLVLFLENSIVGLGICFFSWTNALLWANRSLIAVALADHILLACSKLEQVLLIVFWFRLIDDFRLFLFLLCAVHEENGAQDLA